MRDAAMFALPFLALLDCSARAQGPPGSAPRVIPADSVPVRTQHLLTEQYSGLAQSRLAVIRDPEQWRSVWAEATRDRQRPSPPVDFSRSMVILAAMGTRSTGGHAISIQGVYRSGPNLFVVVREVSPGEECMTTQAPSAPIDAVQLERSDGPVTFVEERETERCG